MKNKLIVSNVLISVFIGLSIFVLSVSHTNAALVGHWTLDADDIDWNTNTIYDVSGNNNNGTAYNLASSSQVQGQIGGALKFNGTDSYINIPVNGIFPVSGNAPRTVCMWFKPDIDLGTPWLPDQNSIFEYEWQIPIGLLV